MKRTVLSTVLMMTVIAAVTAVAARAAEPLPSWNDHPSRTAIVESVAGIGGAAKDWRVLYPAPNP